ncbi:MAG TPA: DNA repair protein RecO [Pyrinomonadaceae bacterium]|nr:DNA repair protein RecO [Pyrinomonadaceae bacterium]
MRLVTTDAIVLRTYNLAESDRIVVCLTRSAGLIRGVAKGARRMKSRFGAALEPFTLIRLAFHEKENRELVAISSADILKSHFALNLKPEVVEVLAYMGELINEFAPPHEADERLFRMLAACVEVLASTNQAQRQLTRYFEIWLLRLAGLFPDLRACTGCGLELTDLVPTFVDAELNAYCTDCRDPQAVSNLSPQVLKLIRATYQLSPVNFVQKHTLTDQEDAIISGLTHRLIARTIERRPRTLVAATR